MCASNHTMAWWQWRVRSVEVWQRWSGARLHWRARERQREGERAREKESEGASEGRDARWPLQRALGRYAAHP